MPVAAFSFASFDTGVSRRAVRSKLGIACYPHSLPRCGPLSDAARLAYSTTAPLHLTPTSDLQVVAEAAVQTPPATTFEPVLNVPALCLCLLIVAVFGLLQVRASAIQLASQKRDATVGTLRDVKARELSGEASETEVATALAEYKEAFEEVEKLRTIAPGIRIASPPTLGQKESMAAARRFLGVVVETDQQATPSSSSPAEQQPEGETERSLPAALAVLLAVLVVVEVGLLVLMSHDPMSASTVLDAAVAGA